MYTIIFQGLLSEPVIPNILKAKKYSDDIVLSTWKGQNRPQLLRILQDNKIKIIELDDPQTIISFEQNGRNFYLNIKRHLYAFYEASKIAKYDYVFKCRCDLSLDFEKFFSIYVSSNRNIGALNWATVNPYKVLSLPYYYHISDWCYVMSRKRIWSCLERIDLMKEENFTTDPIIIGNIKWFVGLSPEQIMTLIYTKNINYESPDRMLFNNALNIESRESIHMDSLSNFVNISRDIVHARSTKYSGRLLRWIMYKDKYFRDKSFTMDIHNLFLYMLKLLLSK
tara:strand:- start:153 stop:998 length:846 start_codon:yes stop_codon:yes gene_type:complete